MIVDRTYRAIWPVVGLLSKREAIAIARPKLRLMLHNAGLYKTGRARYRLVDANEDSERLWPGQQVAQVLIADVPVATEAEEAAA